MDIAHLTYALPAFSQPQTVSLTRISAATLDNWLRYEHVPTRRDDAGRRSFSFADLLLIDSIEMLVSLFKIPPALGAAFARRAVTIYEPGFAADAADISAGISWSAATRDLDAHFCFAREGEAVVEVEQSDDRVDSAMLVLPVRMIARRLLAAIDKLDAQDSD